MDSARAPQSTARVRRDSGSENDDSGGIGAMPVAAEGFFAAWGSTDMGQCGLGRAAAAKGRPVVYPSAVYSLLGRRIVDVAAGPRHTAVLTGACGRPLRPLRARADASQRLEQTTAA